MFTKFALLTNPHDPEFRLTLVFKDSDGFITHIMTRGFARTIACQQLCLLEHG